MAKESLEQKRKRTKKIIIALKKTHPDARLALNFANPLQLLIALILAAQARDDLVNEVTAELFPKYPTATDWANEKEEVLQQHLRKINFYRKKTRSIQKACRVLVERFGRQVPDQLDDLLTVPGVGRKTANIILGNAFGRPAIGVDTHVARLSQRLGLTRLGEHCARKRCGPVLSSSPVSRPAGVHRPQPGLPALLDQPALSVAGENAREMRIGLAWRPRS